MSDEYSTNRTRRYRPNRQVQSSEEDTQPTLLTPEFTGLTVAYGDALLFIGYEVNGRVELTVYPRYRFSSDDRVQGHLGYVHVPYGTPWEEILPQVDAVVAAAQENYTFAVTMRQRDLRAHGSRFDSAYDTIAEIFRECWDAFALRLKREHTVEKQGITFTGNPPGPLLAMYSGRPYTVQVFTTGSILVVSGDRRREFADRRKSA